MGVIQRTGRCLCEAVTFAAEIPDAEISVCHCLQCQRWTGGGPLFSVRVLGLKISGDVEIAHFHASAWGDRAFCRQCGSSIYWAMKGSEPDYIGVGLLDDQTGLHVAEEIFVDHRPDWIPPWVGVSQSTEAEEQEKLKKLLEEQAK